MAKNHESVLPCVKIKAFEERQSTDLKDLAKQLAQKKYSAEENPAIRRLQQRFEKI